MANILIIDDDKAVQVIVKLLLERDNHQVTCAGDGPSALRVFRDGNFDLLIVDIFMPGMDGLETMKRVHEYSPGVPIIVISGHAFSTRNARSPDFLSMSTRLGAVCGLQKPFKSAVLLSHVARCLGRPAVAPSHGGMKSEAGGISPEP